MEPKIENGAWLLFHPKVVGTRQDRIVLVEDQTKIGGERYTLKRYHSEKIYLRDGTWIHGRIFLYPLNSRHAPIPLDTDGNYRICGWYVGHVAEIERVEKPRYDFVAEEG